MPKVTINGVKAVSIPLTEMKDFTFAEVVEAGNADYYGSWRVGDLLYKGRSEPSNIRDCTWTSMPETFRVRPLTKGEVATVEV